MRSVETTFEVEELLPNVFFVVAIKKIGQQLNSTFHIAECPTKGEAHALADALQFQIDNRPAARRRTQWG